MDLFGVRGGFQWCPRSKNCPSSITTDLDGSTCDRTVGSTGIEPIRFHLLKKYLSIGVDTLGVLMILTDMHVASI